MQLLATLKAVVHSCSSVCQRYGHHLDFELYPAFAEFYLMLAT
jgi:hypothetical protein